MKQYKRKPGAEVLAIQIPGHMLYKMWGDVQHGKPGDWLLQNQEEVYTVDAESFARIYRAGSGPGFYVKAAPVWATIAEVDGKVHTKEGYSDYKTGDMLVWNNPDSSDGYCMSQEKFFSLYELDGDGTIA